MPDDDNDRDDGEHAEHVTGVAEAVHDALPLRADAVADPGHGAVPYQTARGGEDAESNEGYLGDPGGDGDEVADERDKPAAEDAEAGVALVPSFGPVEIVVGEQQVLAVPVHNPPPERAAKHPRNEGADHLSCGTNHDDGGKVKTALGSEHAGEAHRELRGGRHAA